MKTTHTLHGAALDNCTESARCFREATKYATFCGGVLEDAESFGDVIPQLKELSQLLIDRGFDDGILQVVYRQSGEVFRLFKWCCSRW